LPHRIVAGSKVVPQQVCFSTTAEVTDGISEPT